MNSTHDIKTTNWIPRWTSSAFLYAVTAVALLLPAFGYLSLRLKHHMWCLEICGPEGAADPMCPGMSLLDTNTAQLFWMPVAISVIAVSVAYLLTHPGKTAPRADPEIFAPKTCPTAKAKVWRSMKAAPLRMAWYRTSGYDLEVELAAMKVDP